MNSAKQNRENQDKVSLSFDKQFVIGYAFICKESENDCVKKNAMSKNGQGQTLSQTEQNGAPLRNVNARRIVRQSEYIESLLLDHAPVIVGITQTWLTLPILNHDFWEPNCSAICKDRPNWDRVVALVIKK